MSNTRRLPPPATVAAIARRWRCTDCTGRASKPWRDRHGIWHATARHDQACPVLAGTVSPAGATLSAAAAAAIETRSPILYVTPSPKE